MESESAAATAALDTMRAVRERAVGMSRPYAWIVLWGAVQMSSYLGLWLLIVHDGASTISSTTIGVLLPTVLLYSIFIHGARERFSSRTRGSAAYVWVVSVVLVAFFGVGGVALFGPGYPWWVAVVIAVLAFAVLALQPVRLLSRPASADGGVDPWLSEPLVAEPRTLTIVLGLYFGTATALVSVPIAGSLLMIATMFLFIVSISAPHARWSLAQVGYAWGRLHWFAYGATILLIYGVVIALWLAGSLPAGILIPCGVLVAAPLVVAAFLPRAR